MSQISFRVPDVRFRQRMEKTFEAGCCSSSPLHAKERDFNDRCQLLDLSRTREVSVKTLRCPNASCFICLFISCRSLFIHFAKQEKIVFDTVNARA